ncbi:MAG: ANTAR domain-containing protein [Sphaerochaetaceae bacterium]
MSKILLVTQSGKAEVALSKLIATYFTQYPEKDRSTFNQLIVANNASDAKRRAFENDFDTIIINCPLIEGNSENLACDLTKTTYSTIIMLVQAKKAKEVEEIVISEGIFVSSKPIISQLFFENIRLGQVTRKRLLSLKKENLDLQVRLEQLKTINQAKLVLIQKKALSEEQAHKYIEQQAMNQRKPKIEIAEYILKTYI